MTVFFASYGTLDTLDALQHARIYGTDAEYRDALAAHYAIVTPPAVTDDAAWHAVLSSGDPEETDGPQEEGGEGGPNPDADRVPSFAAPIPATPAAVTSRVPARQDSGSPWHAKQTWAQSEARRRGLAHPDGGAK